MTPDHFWWWPMWWFPMFMPVFWIIFIIVCFYLIFGRSPRRPWESESGKGTETALDILKKRYARGEITKEEFEQMKRDILG